MENFNLWGSRTDKAGKTVTWFATSAGFHRVRAGTRKTVAQMLTDLGCPSNHIGSWTVGPFATDYLSDDLDTNDWRDRWLASFEITVRMRSSVVCPPPPPSRYLTESMASDATWNGETPAPERLLVVADFGTVACMHRCTKAGTRNDVGPSGPGPVLEESGAHDRQLLGWIPVAPAGLDAAITQAISLEELAHRFGGTTHWRDRLLSEEAAGRD